MSLKWIYEEISVQNDDKWTENDIIKITMPLLCEGIHMIYDVLMCFLMFRF